MTDVNKDFFAALLGLGQQLEEDKVVYHIRDTYDTSGPVPGFENPYTSVVNARAALSILLDMSNEERHALFGYHIPANKLTIIKGTR